MLTFHFLFSSRVFHPRDDSNQFMTRGEIYIETENGFFPCVSWSDKILSSVNMWMSNTIKILDIGIGEVNVTNYFMDGPYAFEIRKVEEGRIEVKFIRQVSGLEKEEIPSLSIAFADYCNALLGLVENMISDPNFQWYGKEQERGNFQKSVALLKALM